MAVNKETTNEEIAEVVDADESTELDSYRPMDVSSAIQGLNNPGSAFFSTISGSDFAGKKAIAAALTSSKALANSLNETIALANIIVQSVQIADDKTGEVNDAPRVTLIDVDGNAFHATSAGLLSSVRNLLGVFGEPSDWPKEGLDIRVVEERGRRGYRFMTIKF